MARLQKFEKTDVAVARALAVKRNSRSAALVKTFSELADQPPLRVICAITIAAGGLRRDRRLLRTGMRMIAAHSFATMAKAFVKDGIDRTRPAAALSGKTYRMKLGDSRAHDLQSMPSGHSAGTAALAAAVVTDYPELTASAVIASGLLITAQLPSRNHYLTDVVVGSAIGLLAFAGARLLLPPFPYSSERA